MEDNNGLTKIELPTTHPTFVSEHSNSEESEVVLDISSKEPEKNKPKKIVSSGKWNYGIQLLLKKIGEKSMGFKWMHNRERVYFEKLDSKYKLATLILLAVIGTISGSEIILAIIDVDSKYVYLSFAIIIFLVNIVHSVVTGIRETEGTNELITSHQTASSKFNKINLDIQTQFTFDIEDRASDKDFLQNTIQYYNDVLDNAPTIRDETANLYMDAIKDKNIYKPLMIGGFEQIEIVINESKNEPETEIRIKSNENIEQSYEDRNKYQIERWLKNF